MLNQLRRPIPEEQKELSLGVLPQTDFKLLYRLIDIAAASSALKLLRLPHCYIRPQLHMILAGGIGCGKSTILTALCKAIGTRPVMNLTSASLAGTVDKQTGEPVIPFVWECRGSILALDELSVNCYDRSARSVIAMLLPLLEGNTFSKRVALRTVEHKETDGEMSLAFSKGTVTMDVRFTLIATMMASLWEPQLMPELEALRSRCLVIPFLPTDKDLRLFIDGKLQYKYNKLPCPERFIVTRRQYSRIKQVVYKADLVRSLRLRTIGDIARVIAVAGWKQDIIDYLIKLRGVTA